MAKVLTGVSSSDWHLNGGIDRLFPEKALEKQMHEIRKPFNYCIENGIQHLFCPGDISDRARLSEDALINLIQLFAYYKDIEFYYTLGNHDFARVGKTAIDVLKVLVDNKVFKNVHLFYKPEIREIDGVDVCFLPFPYNKAQTNDRPSLIFAHAEEVGAIGDYGQKLKVQEDSKHKIRRKKGDVVISGHIHTYQFLKSQRLVYNGSLYQKTFGESLPKGFIEFSAKYSSEGELKFKHTFINSHPEFLLKDVFIENKKDWFQLEHGDHVFYRVSLAEGVVVPKGLTKDYPNVITINGKQKLAKRGEGNEIAVSSNMPKITPLTGLIKMLEAEKLSKKEIKFAVGLVKEALQEI
jgi:DNA repair exonuclease SbcCD nuclease subunit